MLSNQPSCPLLGLLALPAGGLPPTATEAGVREAVAGAGAVEAVHLFHDADANGGGRCRGYGGPTAAAFAGAVGSAGGVKEQAAPSATADPSPSLLPRPIPPKCAGFVRMACRQGAEAACAIAEVRCARLSISASQPPQTAGKAIACCLSPQRYILVP